MPTVTSGDGTSIAYETEGAGEPVVLVASALADRKDHRRLARLLAQRYAVYNYDRRGRGESDDTEPYAVAREIEDLAAIIDAAGGKAAIFGSSSGAVLALRAAAADAPITRLAAYEPPFRVTSSGGEPALGDRIRRLVAEGRRAQAVSAFLKEELEVPGPVRAGMRLMPGVWSSLKSMAHTIPYDLEIVGDDLTAQPADSAPWRGVQIPVLVMHGAKTSARLRDACFALCDELPHAVHAEMPKLGHSAPVTNPKRVAPKLETFFG